MVIIFGLYIMLGFLALMHMNQQVCSPCNYTWGMHGLLQKECQHTLLKCMLYNAKIYFKLYSIIIIIPHVPCRHSQHCYSFAFMISGLQ